jgi:hypothetical protein
VASYFNKSSSKASDNTDDGVDVDGYDDDYDDDDVDNDNQASSRSPMPYNASKKPPSYDKLRVHDNYQHSKSGPSYRYPNFNFNFKPNTLKNTYEFDSLDKKSRNSFIFSDNVNNSRGECVRSNSHRHYRNYKKLTDFGTLC